MNLQTASGVHFLFGRLALENFRHDSSYAFLLARWSGTIRIELRRS
jgi:hypothetical protein